MNPIEKVGIGRTTVQVTRLGFGSVPLGGLYKDVSEEEADATIRRVLALGINYFDTAPIYGFGKAETRLGRELGRDQPRLDRRGHQSRVYAGAR